MGTLIDNRFTRPLAAPVMRLVASNRTGRRIVNWVQNRLPYDARETFFWRFSSAFRQAGKAPPAPGHWIVRFCGRELRMPLDKDTFAADWGFALGALGHDAAVKETYERLVRAGRVSAFLDVGANNGVHSALLAACGVPVTSVEPNPECDPGAARIAALNGLHITRIRAAAGDRTGPAMLSFPSDDTSLGTIDVGIAAALPSRSLRTVAAQMIMIDDLALTSPDLLIKIDVEGLELAVLRGAAQTIGRVRPMIIFESLFADPRRVELFTHFSTLAYAVMSLPRMEVMPAEAFISTRATNFMAWPAERPAPRRSRTDPQAP